MKYCVQYWSCIQPKQHHFSPQWDQFNPLQYFQLTEVMMKLHPPANVFTGLSILKNPPSKTTFSTSGSFSWRVHSAAPSCFILSLIAAFIAASRFRAAVLPAAPSFGLATPFGIVFFWNCKEVWVTSGSFGQKQLHMNIYRAAGDSNRQKTCWRKGLFISRMSWTTNRLLRLVCDDNIKGFSYWVYSSEILSTTFFQQLQLTFLKTGTPRGREMKRDNSRTETRQPEKPLLPFNFSKRVLYLVPSAGFWHSWSAHTEHIPSSFLCLEFLTSFDFIFMISWAVSRNWMEFRQCK